MKSLRRIAIFHDRYPFVGPMFWILSVQYFVVQFVVAVAWPRSFSWSRNLISDLGNTACGTYSGRFVCSPEHGLMNLSFIVLGLTMAVGALLIYQEFRESRASLIGFSCMAIAGLGTILVGAFPENTIAILHGTGAFLIFLVGNIGLVILAFALHRLPAIFRAYTLITGVVTLAALVLFYFQIDFGIGQGTIERIIAYPQTVWLIFFGLYMSGNRFRRVSR